MDRIWYTKLATADGAANSIHGFITRYPENRNIDKAWTRLYQLKVTRNDPVQIANFILDYPDYPHRDVALEDYNLSNERFLKYHDKDLWGFVNLKGEVKVRAQFDWVENFSEGLALVGKGDYSGYINKRGEIVATLSYDDGGTFYQGFAWVEKDGLYGLINAHGKIVLPIEYDDLGHFSEGLVYVQKDAKYAYLNLLLTNQTSYRFDGVTPFSGGVAVVTINYKSGLIDSLGKFLIPPQFNQLAPFGEGKYLLAKKDGFYGLFSTVGDSLLGLEYDYIGNYSEGTFVIAKDGKYGYMNDSLQLQIPMKYDYSSDVSVFASMNNGSIRYKSKGKFGLHDSVGIKIYPAIFEDVGAPGVLTPVKKRGKWGYANPAVRLVIGYKYDFAGPFERGMARVKLDGKWGMIELSGRFLLATEYERIEYFMGDYLLVSKDGETDLLNDELESILPQKYKDIEHVEGQLILLKTEGARAYFDLSSNEFVYKEPLFVNP